LTEPRQSTGRGRRCIGHMTGPCAAIGSNGSWLAPAGEDGTRRSAHRPPGSSTLPPEDPERVITGRAARRSGSGTGSGPERALSHHAGVPSADRASVFQQISLRIRRPRTRLGGALSFLNHEARSAACGPAPRLHTMSCWRPPSGGVAAARQCPARARGIRRALVPTTTAVDRGCSASRRCRGAAACQLPRAAVAARSIRSMILNGIRAPFAWSTEPAR
jgi:hypothetical protein